MQPYHDPPHQQPILQLSDLCQRPIIQRDQRDLRVKDHMRYLESIPECSCQIDCECEGAVLHMPLCIVKLSDGGLRKQNFIPSMSDSTFAT